MGTNVTNVTDTVGKVFLLTQWGRFFYSHSGEDVKTGRSFAGNWNHWSGNLRMMMIVDHIHGGGDDFFCTGITDKYIFPYPSRSIRPSVKHNILSLARPYIELGIEMRELAK